MVTVMVIVIVSAMACDMVVGLVIGCKPFISVKMVLLWLLSREIFSSSPASSPPYSQILRNMIICSPLSAHFLTFLVSSRSTRNSTCYGHFCELSWFQSIVIPVCMDIIIMALLRMLMATIIRVLFVVTVSISNSMNVIVSITTIFAY